MRHNGSHPPPAQKMAIEAAARKLNAWFAENPAVTNRS
jgi:hypothetical protein